MLSRLLDEYSAFDAVFLDPHPFRVGEYSKISKNDFGEWRRYVQAAAKRPDFGGCVLLLDGDSSTKVDGQPFCVKRAARRLAAEAQKVGAGRLFSAPLSLLAWNLNRWLIAGVDSLVDKPFADGRKELPSAQEMPPDPEWPPETQKVGFGNYGNRLQTGSRPG